jgi:hypothetical protein
MNLKLYLKSMSLINIPSKKRYCHTTSDGYIYKILKEDVDYIVNIDEDAFIYDHKALYSLLDYIIENDYINCGMRDGGILTIRIHHPLITNPFFNILNVKKIREKLNHDEIVDTKIFLPDYIKMLPEKLNGKYAFDDSEPYSRIFIWLAINYKTLYLDAIRHKDGLSTILLNQNNEPFLYHSWFSREYNKDNYHTNRIDNLYTECMLNNIRSNKSNMQYVILQLMLSTIYMIQEVYYKGMRFIKSKTHIKTIHVLTLL